MTEDQIDDTEARWDPRSGHDPMATEDINNLIAEVRRLQELAAAERAYRIAERDALGAASWTARGARLAGVRSMAADRLRAAGGEP